MTSRQLIIPEEDPADLEELHCQWHDLCPTDNPVAERALDSEWLLMRVERQADEINAELFKRPMAKWSDADHSRYAVSQRYTTPGAAKHEPTPAEPPDTNEIGSYAFFPEQWSSDAGRRPSEDPLHSGVIDVLFAEGRRRGLRACAAGCALPSRGRHAWDLTSLDFI